MELILCGGPERALTVQGGDKRGVGDAARGGDGKAAATGAAAEGEVVAVDFGLREADNV